jgi:hypothetical protein
VRLTLLLGAIGLSLAARFPTPLRVGSTTLNTTSVPQSRRESGRVRDDHLRQPRAVAIIHSLAVFIDGAQSSTDSVRIAELPQDSCRLSLLLQPSCAAPVGRDAMNCYPRMMLEARFPSDELHLDSPSLNQT